MRPRVSAIDGFVSAVHRRWIVLRIIERAGVGLLCASGAGAVLVAVLLWQDRPALGAAGGILVIGAITGALAGWMRRPGRFAAALEADRQLDLGDLLSTAVAMMNRPDSDPWRGTVLALAEARVRELSPNSLVLRRLGSRAWGGIGLSAALVLTLGLMSTTPTQVVAQRSAFDHSITAATTPAPRHSDDAIARQPAPPVSADDDRAVRRVTPDVHTAIASSDAPNTEPSTGESRHAGADARGGGSARTDQPQALDALASEPPGGNVEPIMDEPASGSGTAAAPVSSQADDPAGRTTTGAATTSPPPWTTPQWSTDRARALQAVESGAIPDAYRPMVREYFQAGAGSSGN